MTTSHFAIYAIDKAGLGALRDELRERHRTYIRAANPHGVVTVLGGPLIDERGRMNGSLLIVEAASIGRARDFLAGDPYVVGGLFERVEVREWLWGLGKPEAAEPSSPPAS